MIMEKGVHFSETRILERSKGQTLFGFLHNMQARRISHLYMLEAIIMGEYKKYGRWTTVLLIFASCVASGFTIIDVASEKMIFADSLLLTLVVYVKLRSHL